MVPVLAVRLLPTEANSDATTAMAARLMLGRPRAPARDCPSPQAAVPNAKARDILSTVGAAAAAALVAVAVATAVTVAMVPREARPANRLHWYITYILPYLEFIM